MLGSAWKLTSGLSPRRRGNPSTAPSARRPPRPIPAQAGEPVPAPSQQSDWKAYPRAGGGTVAADGGRFVAEGLSPRRRGNPALALPALGETGPIPAQAGEPLNTGMAASLYEAYPRAGGGTEYGHGSLLPIRGLSPRRRGNLRQIAFHQALGGPIPAQAGEPGARRPPGGCPRAYPRAGGGTNLTAAALAGRGGLSPRRRGNPASLMDRLQASGPIPAQAGEPSS